jgi:hypothetical protein
MLNRLRNKMLSTKTKTTNKKFYNKWLYKTTLQVSGAGIFRMAALGDIKLLCNLTEAPLHAFRQSVWHNKELIDNICNFLLPYNKSDYATRIESRQIDYYTNDKLFYDAISEKFESYVVHRFEPGANIDLLDASTIMVKKLPKNQYQYRAYLLPHKMAGDKEAKQKYLDWIKSQSTRITCTESLQSWFMHTDWNWDRRYVLVQDEATLLMLKLRDSTVLGRIYKFVVSDK